MGSRPNLTVKCSANDHSVSVIEIDGQVSWRQKPTSGVNSRDPAISYKLVPWCLHLAALLFNRLWLKQQGKLTPDVEDSRDFFLFVSFLEFSFFFFAGLHSLLSLFLPLSYPLLFHSLSSFFFVFLLSFSQAFMLVWNVIDQPICCWYSAQFGSWNYGPQHGFARIIRWHVEKPPERLPSGDMEAIFCIMDNEITRSTWNYP